MPVTIKLQRGNSTDWTSQNIILASGEPGYEIDTGRLKIGDGTTAWNSLSYASVIPTGILAGSGIDINLAANGSTATISVSGLNSSYISDFNEAVDDRVGSGLFVAGTGINLAYNDPTNSFTVSVTGLIANPTNNRILTSRDSTTTGIDAESNLTFNGSLLSVSGNLVANTGTLDILQFYTNNGSVNAQGQLGWNDTEGTVDVALTDTAYIHIGEHRYFRIRNQTGNPLYKGQVVYASGVHSNGLISPAKYVADGSIREVRFMGVVLEDVNHNNNGHVLDFGHIENMDLDGSVSNFAVGDETWVAGDILYVHPTVPGKLTKIEPKHSISVAIILDPGNGNGNGRMFVRPTSYGHIDDNHDVNVSGATNGQFLQYNSATDYWVPSSSGNFTTLLVNGTGVSVNGHTHTSSDITNFNTSVSGLLPTISNSGDNRILTSTGTSTGVNAESNATFDGTTLSVTGDITVDNLKLDGNTISTTNTDGSLILSPNNHGALQRDHGGNARGQYAIDWQTFRSSNDQVAAGNFSVIAGGKNNTSSGYSSAVCGGDTNTSSGPSSIVSGGKNNTSSNSYSTIGGGYNNNATGYTSTISGGQNNTASGYHGSNVSGGRGNTASGTYSTIGGGLNNQANDYSSTVAGGQSNVITSSAGYYNNSTISGGGNNQIYGGNNTIGGGSFNSISAYSYGTISGGTYNVGHNYGSIGGGFNNNVGSYGVIGGGRGNNNSGTTNSTIGGGFNNTVSGNYGTVGGGESNNAIGFFSTVSGGSANTSSGYQSTVGGGSSNTSSGDQSTVGGGFFNTSSGTNTTVPGGVQAKASRYGELSHSAGAFSVIGDAQHSILIARRTTTNATANQVLFLDGASARLTLPAETTWAFSVKLSAYNDTDNEGGWWIFRGGIRRNDANGTALIGSLITESGVESSLSSASASVVADDTNEALEIRVTGITGKNIRWVAVVDISQVSYGTP